jgi:hypothetical protein
MEGGMEGGKYYLYTVHVYLYVLQYTVLYGGRDVIHMTIQITHTDCEDVRSVLLGCNSNVVIN